MAAAGEAASKLSRFLYFVGAGVICTKAINTYREYERNQEAATAAAASAAVVEVDPAPASAAAAAAKP